MTRAPTPEEIAAERTRRREAFRTQHPELAAIADELRAKGGPDSVHIRCIHDADGKLIMGKLPDDMQPSGPIPPLPPPAATPAPAAAPYRGKPRPK